MSKFTTASLAAIASLALLAGCSAPKGSESASGAPSAATTGGFPVTVKHNNGETTIKEKPKRIVVIDMAALDTIDALGAGDRVVGLPTKNVPTWLKDSEGIDYSKLPNTGSLREPDMEALARLKPDLVILGNRAAPAYAELSKVYTTIDTSVAWTNSAYSTEVPANIKMIGQAIGEEKAANAAADAIAKKIAEYQDSAKDKGTAMVLMTSGGEVSLHGTKSRWAPLYDVFGFTPIQDKKADVGHKGQKISFETVKELNPDWIFVVDRDAAIGRVKAGVTAKQILDNELVAATTAAKNGRIVYLTPERWYIVMTGASNFLAELEEVATAVKSAK